MPAVPAADPAATTPNKPVEVSSAKRHASTPQVAQNPAPRQDTSQQDPPQPAPATPRQNASQQAAPAVQPASSAPPDHRATEQSARKTVASVAQLAALEHEEFDELSARDNSVNARIAALSQQPGADVAASQQRARNELTLAQKALQIADVQNAQKYMDQADAEITKIEKILGH
jgi:hypothetical protein